MEQGLRGFWSLEWRPGDTNNDAVKKLSLEMEFHPAEFRKIFYQKTFNNSKGNLVLINPSNW